MQSITFLYRLGRGATRFCFSKLGRMEVAGKECVPPYGPLIVVSNHLSYNDPPLLAASINRPLHFIAKKELFHDPISSYALKKWHVSPFDRSGSRADALRILMRLLAEDKAVVVFPEGHRSPDHTMKEGLLGVVYLALKSQAPILPVGLSGTEKFPGWRMPIPLSRMRANIGPPFTLPIIEGRPSREVMQSMLDMVMRRIALLLPEEYQGDYALSNAPWKGEPATIGSQP